MYLEAHLKRHGDMSSIQGADAPTPPNTALDGSQSSEISINAMVAKQQPPPETAESIWTRRWVVFSFWAVVIFLGLPVWWKATAIYRADLPLQVMTDWADGKVRILLQLKESRSPDSRHADHFSLFGLLSKLHLFPFRTDSILFGPLSMRLMT